jgi:hypothetical protein
VPAAEVAPPACPKCVVPSVVELPSSVAARDFINGVPGSGWRVLGTTAVRAGLISLGAFIGGGKDFYQNVKTGAISAAVIEAAVLGQMIIK